MVNIITVIAVIVAVILIIIWEMKSRGKTSGSFGRGYSSGNSYDIG